MRLGHRDADASRRSPSPPGSAVRPVPASVQTGSERPALIGRERELDLVDALIRQLPDRRGAALVLRGEPGIGKSALLAVAAASAAERGVAVSSATGVQAEAGLGFAGLHRLLQPALPGAERLPSAQQAAIEAAFGSSGQSGP